MLDEAWARTMFQEAQHADTARQVSRAGHCGLAGILNSVRDITGARLQHCLQHLLPYFPTALAILHSS